MKSLYSIRMTALAAVVFLLPPQISFAAQTPAHTGFALQERLIKAAEQLRAGQSRVAFNKLNRATSEAAAADFGIKINRDVKTSSTIFFYDNMENGTNGWTTEVYGGSADLWHQTTRDASSPTHSWWCGVEDSGTYNTGHRVNTALISPPVNLAGAIGSVQLVFAENYFTEKKWDRCWVDATTDNGSTWNTIRVGTRGNSLGWIIRSFDLTSYANQTIKIRFYFDTQDSVANNFPGWFVDDVVIFDQGGAIAGTVFGDQNGNGIWEPQQSEVGLSGWYVKINGPISLTAITGASNNPSPGFYEISLPQGNYTVSDSLVSGWTQTSPPGGVWNISLNTPGTTLNTLNFGVQGSLTIVRGMKFNDLNHNGVKDPGEPGIPNWDIHIEPVMYGMDPETFTDSLGNYVFYLTVADNYNIWESGEQWWRQSYPGSSWWFTTTVSGGVMQGFDFGNYINHSSSIAGSVFDDTTRNGRRDIGEYGLANWGVNLWGPFGASYYVLTDSNGHYRADSLEPGYYTLSENQQTHWTQSYPPSNNWSFSLDSNTVRDSVDFGNYRIFRIAKIRGWLFNDANRNHTKDSADVPLAGWPVSFVGDSTGSTTSDSNGYYEIAGLWPGGYWISLSSPRGWWQSHGYQNLNVLPESTYTNINLGAYQIVPGSIRGIVFRDANGNGAQDTGDTRLANWQIFLSGDTSATTSTNDSGVFIFSGLWPGGYTLSEASRNHWSQTSPMPSHSYYIGLGPEENRIGIDFGNVETKLLPTYFRTFTPESLALAVDTKNKHRSVQYKPWEVSFTSSLTIPASDSGLGLNGLVLNFKIAVDSSTIVINPPFPNLTYEKKFKVLALSGRAIGGNEVITISGVGTQAKDQTIKVYTTRDDILVPYHNKAVLPVSNTYLYPLPNAINVLERAWSGVFVGLRGPHSVVFGNSSDVYKSLYQSPGHQHTGDPRCLDKFANRRLITKQQRYLKPSQHNNILFAEAIALKLNIAASKLFVLPLGFGGLIFSDTSDTSNPLNGKPIQTIAAVLDTFMSSYSAVAAQCVMPTSLGNMTPEGLYTVVRKINTAFSGPIDIVNFNYSNLRLTGVRDIADVPYLHVDTSGILSAFNEIPPLLPPPVPREFALDQNYPNPFNPLTTIGFALPQEAKVTLKIFNLLGQEVATLLNREDMDEGEQHIDFDASHLASGVYFYRISVEGIADENGEMGQSFSAVRKMVLLK